MKQSMKSLFEEVIEAKYQAYIGDVKADYFNACAEAKAMQLRVQKQRLKEQRLWVSLVPSTGRAGLPTVNNSTK